MSVRVITTCAVENCTAQVVAEWEPGEAQTRDYPGYQGYWITYKHGGVNIPEEITDDLPIHAKHADLCDEDSTIYDNVVNETEEMHHW